MKKITLFGYALLFTGFTASAQFQIKSNTLITEWGQKVTAANAWRQYPRPQHKRDLWQNLNGSWEYAIQAKNLPTPTKFQGNILVPFCVESSLSGVGKILKPDERLFYKREFDVPENWNGKNILINFDAVDWSSTIWLNGALVGSHKGGYDRFSFDITPYLKKTGKQQLIVAVDDPSSFGMQARGKQQLPQQGIWYTPVSGIWQTVWIEPVSKTASINEIKVIPDIDQKSVTIIPVTDMPLRPEYFVNVSVMDGKQKVASGRVLANKELELKISNPKLWSPESPFLYDLQLTLTDKNGATLDEISSYFGMRKISLGMKDGVKYTFLNNKPYFQYGLLDQGWWPDGLYTPPSEEAMVFDLIKTKEMGFNMVRKHIKVEPDIWYYNCDKMGLLVWQDMPSGMVVEPVSDTVKPIHLEHVQRNKEDLNRNSEATAQYEWEMRRMIDLHYNHPSIVTWVPLNEGWGQYATIRLAKAVKELDPTRLVNAISGWSLRPVGDMHDIHTYQVKVEVPSTSTERAAVIGEFGGIGQPVEGHLWDNSIRNWGYQTYKTSDELLKNYKIKFDQIVDMKKNKGLSAAVYTQTTDVEGEVNGLITYDRKVMKIPVETLKAMHAELYK